MTNQSSASTHHYNQLSWGPCHFYRSALTGKRLVFRSNEIASVRSGFLSDGILTSVGGYEFQVTSIKPEIIK